MNDSWDRVAFAKEYAAEQKRDLMLTGISGILKKSPPKEVEKAIDQALTEFAGDATAVTKLNDMKASIVLRSLYKSIDAGENTKVLATIKELYPNVSKKVQRLLLGIQVKFQIKESQFPLCEMVVVSCRRSLRFELSRLVIGNCLRCR